MRCARPDTMYSYTSATNVVTFTVEPGEVFQVETVPTCGRQFDTRTGKESPDAEGGINASTGCIALAGAKPGQVLVVHVLDIKLHEFGYTRLSWRPSWMGGPASQAGSVTVPFGGYAGPYRRH